MIEDKTGRQAGSLGRRRGGNIGSGSGGKGGGDNSDKFRVCCRTESKIQAVEMRLGVIFSGREHIAHAHQKLTHVIYARTRRLLAVFVFNFTSITIICC